MNFLLLDVVETNWLQQHSKDIVVLVIVALIAIIAIIGIFLWRKKQKTN